MTVYKRRKKAPYGLWSIVFLFMLGVAAGLKWAWDFSTTRDSNEYTYHLHQIAKACVEQAGEYIFRKVENVEGVAQLRLRNYVGEVTIESLSKSNSTPYDLYGYNDIRTIDLPSHFFELYQYFEAPIQLPAEVPSWSELHKYMKRVELDQADKVLRYYGYTTYTRMKNDLKIVGAQSFRSQYGFTFKETYTKEHGYEDLIGSELIVIDMNTQEILGVRKAFHTRLFGRNVILCPVRQHIENDSFFVRKVIPPRQR
jgi:hypothetical protein